MPITKNSDKSTKFQDQNLYHKNKNWQILSNFYPFIILFYQELINAKKFLNSYSINIFKLDDFIHKFNPLDLTKMT